MLSHIVDAFFAINPSGGNLISFVFLPRPQSAGTIVVAPSGAHSCEKYKPKNLGGSRIRPLPLPVILFHHMAVNSPNSLHTPNESTNSRHVHANGLPGT